MAYKNLKNRLRKKYGCKCMLCRRKLPLKETTFHHILPLSKGGKSTEENGALLCELRNIGVYDIEFENENDIPLNTEYTEKANTKDIKK